MPIIRVVTKCGEAGREYFTESQHGIPLIIDGYFDPWKKKTAR